VALSLPLVVAVLIAPARQALDWIAGLSQRMPLWTGFVLIVLGLWSIGFGLFVSPAKPA
jgi:cytochrome c-type biogenesis protein